jgi:hypothetical protein
VAKVKEVYLENAQAQYTPPIDIESNVRLIVEADDQESSDKTIVGFVDISMWELDSTIDG